MSRRSTSSAARPNIRSPARLMVSMPPLGLRVTMASKAASKMALWRVAISRRSSACCLSWVLARRTVDWAIASTPISSEAITAIRAMPT